MRLLIAASPGEVRGALLDAGGRLVELMIERDFDPPLRGRLYLARVERVVPALDAAFLDLGGGVRAFLARRDAAHAPALRVRGRPPGPADPEAPVAALLAEGEHLVVQIERDGGPGKEPRATTAIALEGYGVTRRPLGGKASVAKAVAEAEERARLGALGRAIGGGLVLGAAAAGAPEAAIRAEIAALDARWAEARARAAEARGPRLLDPGDHAAARMLRALAGAGSAEVVVEGAGAAAAARSPLAPPVREHRAARPLFEAEGVEAQIEAALARRVTLPGGGALTFDPAEAATVIDVDTGAGGRGGRAQAVRDANLEAAAEIARQLRLRAIAGPVVIDFVRMPRAADRRRVATALAEAAGDDPAQLRLGGFTALGLFELTRSRERPPLAELMLAPAGEPAPAPAALATEALRAAQRTARRAPGRRFTIEAAPAVAAILEGPARPAFETLDRRLGGRLALRRGGPGADGFAIVAEADGG